MARPFVLGRIYGLVGWRATTVSSRLTNVPRLNLKPPASRSLPVDYGLDKSFLENRRATPSPPPSFFPRSFLPLHVIPPRAFYPRDVYLLDSCSRGNQAVVYINPTGPSLTAHARPLSLSLVFTSCLFFRAVFQLVVFGDGPGIESLYVGGSRPPCGFC